MAKFPRRKFLKTIGGAAVATALPNAILGAQSQSPSVALFSEPGFPAIQRGDFTLETLQQALKDFTVTVLSERDLIAQLDASRFDLLVTPFGSAFPKRAWPAMLKYLRDGGNWLNIGGVPLSRPVVRAGSEWRAEPQQTTFHKQLGITHSFAVNGAFLKLNEYFALYVRLSSSNNEPDEAGSDGPHEGVVRPLELNFDGDKRIIAAPVIEVDRLLGEFAGGRWVLANSSRSIEASSITFYAQRAAQGASRFEVRSDFAAYKPGETPTLSVELFHPKGDLQKLATKDCSIEVRDNADQIVLRLNVPLKIESTKATGSVKLPGSVKLAPGLYKVKAAPGLIVGAALRGRPSAESHAGVATEGHPYSSIYGFWIYHEALLARGKPLTVDKHFFYRDGKVFPVTGTTYMALRVATRWIFPSFRISRACT